MRMILVIIEPTLQFRYNSKLNFNLKCAIEPYPLKEPRNMLISELKPYERAKILGYHQSKSPYRSQLLQMGLTPGAEFQLIQIAPLGDPVQIELRGYILSLRQQEASILNIEKVS